MADLSENPVINSPFVEPERHFRFDENGITHEILSGRRHRRVASRDLMQAHENRLRPLLDSTSKTCGVNWIAQRQRYFAHGGSLGNHYG